MNNKTNTPIAYHGKWRIPEYDSWKNIIGFQECMGTLTCSEEGNTLEVYHEPKQGMISHMYASHEVIFGKEANGRVFTLFNAIMVNEVNFSKTTYKVRLVLVDREVKSLDEPVYDECRIRFPYLKEWAFDSRLNFKESRNEFRITLNTDSNTSILQVDVDENTTLSLFQFYNIQTTRYDFSITQDTQLYINAKTKISIREFLKHISMFTDFLSIALFGKQAPSIVEFKNKKETKRVAGRLLFETETSTNPSFHSLINFEKNKVRLPEFIRSWFANYEQMAPICNYLIDSIHTKTFDVPNFLVIAQALDGYFKRFVNKKDGKNTTQYEHQIKKLLEHFKGVEMLQACNLDAKVLAHSRHKYSHLIPDDETKNVEKAVSGEELYYLTRKGIVLLTCCILDNLGLTIDEINICFKDSAVEEIVHDIPFWYTEEEK